MLAWTWGRGKVRLRSSRRTVSCATYMRNLVQSSATTVGIEAGRSDEEKGKLSAVHFVRFAFPPEAIRAFKDADVWLVVDQPGEKARTQLSEDTKDAKKED